MRTTQQFSNTLPHQMPQMVRSEVQSGGYASESEVIRDVLRALQVHERALEDWLRKDVAAAYDAMRAYPSWAVPVEKVRASLTAAHKSASRPD